MKKGFAMIEVVIVMSIIFTTSLGLYVSIQNVSKKSEQLQKYDSAENIYALNTIKVFLYRYYNVNRLCNYVLNVDTDDRKVLPLVSITSSKKLYNIDFDDDANIEGKYDKMFKSLVKELNIKTLLFTNFSDILGGIDADTSTQKVKEDINLNEYIEYIDNKTTNQLLYLLIAEFNDGTFASINMYKTSR